MDPRYGMTLWATVYYEHAIWHLVRYKRIAEVINKNEGSCVLDVGSGLGLMELMLSNKEVVAVDVNRKDVVESMAIRKKYQLAENTFCGIVADLHHLPFAKKFDTLVCSEVLEHLHDDRKALTAILSNLKEKGLLIITLPNKLRMEFDQPFRMTLRPARPSKGHLREYEVNDLQHLIKSLPVKIKKVDGIYFDFPLFHIFYVPIRAFARIRPSKKIQFLIYTALCRLHSSLWKRFDSLFWQHTYHILVLLRKL